MIDVSILIPSLYRSHRLESLVDSIIENTTCSYELLFVVPEDDNSSRDILEFMTLDCPIHVFLDKEDMRFVTRIQTMYENSQSNWIFTGADDIEFSKSWFENAIKESPKWAEVISFDDQNNPNVEGTNFLINSHHIKFKSCVFDEPNRVFYSGYKHNFCDNELVLNSKMQDVFYHSSVPMKHYHWTTGGRERDSVDNWAQNNWDHDASLWNERATKIIDSFATSR